MSIPIYKRTLEEQVAYHIWLKSFGEQFDYDKDGGVSTIIDRETRERGNRQSSFFLMVNENTKAFTVTPIVSNPQAGIHQDNVLKAFLEEGVAAAAVKDKTAPPEYSAAPNTKAYETKITDDEGEELLKGWVVCEAEEEQVIPKPEFEDEIELRTNAEMLARAQEDQSKANALNEREDYAFISTERPEDKALTHSLIPARKPRLKTNIEAFLETEKGKKARVIVRKLFTLDHADETIHEQHFNSTIKKLWQSARSRFSHSKTEWTANAYICPFTGDRLNDENAIQLRLHKPLEGNPTKEEVHWVTVSRRGLRRYLLSMQEEYRSLPAGFDPETVSEDDIRAITKDNYEQAQLCKYKFNDKKFDFKGSEFELIEN